MRKTSDGTVLTELSKDAGLTVVTPRVAYFAESEVDAVDALSLAIAEGLPVTPRGGGTSIPTQSVGAGAILLQPRRGVKSFPGLVECEPGTVKSELNAALAEEGMWMPVDPSSYSSCTIGGMAANNASGARTPKYGSTIGYVTRLRVVAPGGGASDVVPLTVEDALSGGPRERKVASLILENRSAIEGDEPKVTKNSSGYRLEKVVHDGVVDFPKLFVGSEGTLGVFTQVTLRTIPVPKWRLLLVAEAPLEGLDRVTSAFRGLGPAALELVDKSVYRFAGQWDMISRFSRSDDPYLIFCELDGEEGDGNARLAEVAASPAAGYDPLTFTSAADISAAWQARGGTLTLAQDMKKGARRPVPGVEDLVVPQGSLGRLVKLLTEEFEKRGLDYILYGHAGDANLHGRPLLDLTSPSERRVLDELMEECFEAVWKLGGSMTGEHGDGMLRARYVERQYPKTYWIMEELKEIYDPRRVLNPGVKLPLKAPT